MKATFVAPFKAAIAVKDPGSDVANVRRLRSVYIAGRQIGRGAAQRAALL